MKRLALFLALFVVLQASPAGAGCRSMFGLGACVAAAGGGGSTTTFDPANKSAVVTLSPGNLIVQGGAGADGSARSIASSSARFAVEFHLTGTLGSPGLWVGAGNASASVANGNWAGSDAFRTGIYNDRHVWRAGLDGAFDGVLSAIASGDYLLMEVDPLTTTWSGGAAPNGVVRWKANGTVSLDYPLPAGPLYVFAGFTTGSGATITANFGATAFVNPTTYGPM